MGLDLERLGAGMRADSESWHKGIHGRTDEELRTHYALGLCGEAGEVADEIKKMSYDAGSKARHVDLAAELADVFTYLLLLADLEGVNLIDEYAKKRAHNIERWGDPDVERP